MEASRIRVRRVLRASSIPGPCPRRTLRSDGPEVLAVWQRFRAEEVLTEGSVVNFGDITQISDDDLRALGPVDVLEGSSPCQSFSIAGLRLGLDDDRGNLMLAFAQLAPRMREINGLRFVVWENVKGVLSDATNGFGCLLAAFGGGEAPLVPPRGGWPNSGHMLAGATDDVDDITVAWRVLNSERFDVPQRRERVFLVASFDPVIDAGSVLFEYKAKNGLLRRADGRKKKLPAVVRMALES